MPMAPHGQLGAEVDARSRTDREPTSGSRHAAQNARTLSSSSLHPLRREHPRDERTVHGVQRRVLVDEHARRHDRVCLDHLEDVALGRAEPLPVLQRRLDVGESAQAPEVEPLVVVERRLVPQPPVGRVRIGVDLDVVRVVVQTRSRPLL